MIKQDNKILITGHEIGGQMQLLAETIRRRGIGATAVAYNNDFRGYQNDINLGNASTRERINFFRWALRHYDVFHFFWGVSMLGFWRFHLLDLPLLRLKGKKIFPHFRGLDVVDIKYFDYLRAVTNGEKVQKPPMSRADQLKRLKKWIKYSDSLLISEPDLHEVVPDAILSPQVIDLNYWKPGDQEFNTKNQTIRIVHAPSSRRKKGTEYIEKAVENLQGKGYLVELILAENYEAHRIKELYARADIGVDQLLYGWHGKVSCELMAMELPVICYINPSFSKYRPDLPIINATPLTIEEELEKLILSEVLRKEFGKKGRAYVEKYHDVEVVVDELLRLYGFSQVDYKNYNQLEYVKTW